MSDRLILSTAYFAPVQYFAKIVKHKTALIEVLENYSKQSYRNRCRIYGANGIQTLSVPIKKKKKKKCFTKDIKID